MKSLGIFILLLSSINSYSLDNGIKQVEAVGQYSKNVKEALVIKGSFANFKAQHGESHFGVKNGESLSVRVVDIRGADQSIPDDFYVRVRLAGYSPENLRGESLVAIFPDFITERNDVYEELYIGDELVLEGRDLNQLPIGTRLDSDRVIRVELGQELLASDSLYGTYALNPIQLEKLERGEKIRLNLEDTAKSKRTLTKAVVEISKK